jgi:hypothetical protein
MAIKGYRELTDEEVNVVNTIKTAAEDLGFLLESLNNNPNITLDPRWFATGKTDLQKGFMSITRAITRPETF